MGQSSFEFLSCYPKYAVYYKNLLQLERLYSLGFFTEELTSARKIAEQLTKDILQREKRTSAVTSTFAENLNLMKNCGFDSRMIDLFYNLKSSGNKTAHTMIEIPQEKGRAALLALYQLFLWYVRHYDNPNVKIRPYNPPDGKLSLYGTSERKLIYVQTADNSKNEWPRYAGLEKIGEASINKFEIDGRANSEDLRKFASKRISQYMTTAGIPYNLQWVELACRKDNTWFRDHDVHHVLERSNVKKTSLTEGNEWFETDVETAKKAIAAVKEGRNSIDVTGPVASNTITLRPEQRDAIDRTKDVFKHKKEMLWNAKMRFGKTLSSLQLIKEMQYKKVLIMTHRPVVSDSWFDDFKKIGMSAAGYTYGSQTKGEKLEDLWKNNKPFIYFASLQDLRGSKIFGGIVADKNQLVAEIPWDLVIIDEAHEGTQTELAQKVIDGVRKDHTRLLELSGTPFNLLDEYDPDQVYTWDYVMEQEAKEKWPEEHPGEPNPYEGLPRVNMFTFEIKNEFKDSRFIDVTDKSFNFHEFFRVNDAGEFVYKKYVQQFLDNISRPSKTSYYPFSTKEFRNELRHTLWLLPSIKAATAMKKMMEEHPVFGMEYTIINAVDNGDTEGEASASDLERVRNAITDEPSKTKTITLTVRKLTAGVNIKEWTAVIFLSNTNSSMQYLQAAFRAQTPFSDKVLGMKTNCYVFDFAPDRALTVMADSSRLHSGLGKKVTGEQKKEMGKLLNFLPIIGESGNGMKEFPVDEMLRQLKRAYAEKAVRTGFDDDSIYSDDLLQLKDVNYDDFNHLKGIVGTTKKEKRKMTVPVNQQGMGDEEREAADRGRKKRKKNRTPEEEAALAKLRELRKQSKALKSVLRGVSIRIPLMIYGLDVDFSDDVSIEDFINHVDDKSWAEFMPTGVNKALFRKFLKYYDPEVFIEAGHIIRGRVKNIDNDDPLERTEEIADIFAHFRNPDKETVLTPWRVVNMHVGKVFGGLSFYDKEYHYTTEKGDNAAHWIQTELTDHVFTPDTHILEINSKTGLYPLYETASLYYQAFKKMNDRMAGKFTLQDEQALWEDILAKNIYVIAKTPMAKVITERTLAGYHDWKMNVKYIDGLVESLKKSIPESVEKVKKGFGKQMKFDAVIGNPPYQDTSKGDNDTFKAPLYNLFTDLAYKLSDRVSLITPARYLFGAGSTPKKWNEEMLNDPHLKIVMYEAKSNEIFANTDIKGGIVITYRDKNQDFGKIGVFKPFKELDWILKKVKDREDFKEFSQIVYSRTSYRITEKLHQDYPEAEKYLSKGHRYDMSTNIMDLLPFVFYKDKPQDKYEYIKIFGRTANQRTYQYIRRDYVNQVDNLDKWKVFVPKSNGSGALGEVLTTPVIGQPVIGHTESFISIGCFDSESEVNACLKYVKTKFARCMLGILKVTQDNPPDRWRFIPLQDFTNQSDIDWSGSIHDIDRQLYKKYKLDQKEIDFIESHVQAM